MTKIEFELRAMISVVGGIVAEKGIAHIDAVQEYAQRLTDAAEKRGLFNDTGDSVRYRSPQQGRNQGQNIPAVQERVLDPGSY